MIELEARFALAGCIAYVVATLLALTEIDQQQVSESSSKRPATFGAPNEQAWLETAKEGNNGNEHNGRPRSRMMPANGWLSMGSTSMSTGSESGGREGDARLDSVGQNMEDFGSTDSRWLNRGAAAAQHGDYRPSEAQAATTTVASGGELTVTSLANIDCLGPVQAQGACAACYAFSVVSVLEYMLCRDSGIKRKLSEQFIVDCSVGPRDHGCLGGRVESAIEFAHSSGLMEARLYPYAGFRGACRVNDTSELRPVYKLTSGGSIGVPRSQWAQWLARDQPLIVIVRLGDDEFNRYGGGVDNPVLQPTERHAMVLVAVMADQRGQYYVLRNSFGAHWGTNGYYKIRASSPALLDRALHPDGRVEACGEESVRQSE
jgi:hypothetical protein